MYRMGSNCPPTAVRFKWRPGVQASGRCALDLLNCGASARSLECKPVGRGSLRWRCPVIIGPMPIKFAVAPGALVLCNYATGFRTPEMVKRRPVVVISPRLPHRDGLCTVVPLSTTPPHSAVAYQCRLEIHPALPPPFSDSVCWAKADMLATVSFERIDLFRTERDSASGRRRYLHPKVTKEDLARIRECVMMAIGFPGFQG
jgi:mRNA interferase MazF